MGTDREPRFGSALFLVSLAGIGVLPLAPELGFLFRGQADLKYLAPICYYEALVSFLLLAPALFLNRFGSRAWVLVVGVAFALSTLIVGAYAACYGARWGLSADASLMQTNWAEAGSFVRTFVSVSSVAWVVLIAAGFAVSISVNFRSPLPSRRRALVVVGVGLLFGAHGILNAIRYNGPFFHTVPPEGGPESVRIAEIGVNKTHPLLLVALTHYNVLATHRYYLRKYDEVERFSGRLAGAAPLPGAKRPRVVVIVVGESANRLHWSLYGYPRATTPRLADLRSELHVFTDVISSYSYTLGSFRAMLTVGAETVPIFPVFSQAGYSTHWLSAQYNQGVNDLEIVALVKSNEESVFLNGAYDENLVPLMAQAAALPGPQMIFLNLFGSHVRYEDRYPSSFAAFDGDGFKEKLRATYDNSVRYTDHVLGEMIEALRKRHESSCLVYFSDHGEDVFDSRPDKYLFRDESLATDPMYEVPFVVWFSPEYVHDNPQFVRSVAAATGRRFQSRALVHSLLSLTRMTQKLYDPSADLFSPQFVEKVRRVGSMARVYETPRGPGIETQLEGGAGR
jgi:heptose-I-phosphate ethanolaminephosphotransferase